MKRIYRVAEKPLKQSAKWLVLASGALLSACGVQQAVNQLGSRQTHRIIARQ
ncbi:hypothetical protein [Vibrio fluvialis]|uniref:hypothetical protein n=1 Tax=Vibrio fluvialis TaxID=676 RepID=UPI001EEAD7CA|nr:hypothetical protein [Vibrio fluvialis]MCG6402446.1 hypothetical protein [Vibrio fluvialis]